MKIERIWLHHLRMKLVGPFETSFGRTLERDCILIEAACDGLVGFGECVADRKPGYAYETTETAWHVLRDFLVPLVLDHELESVDDFQRRAAVVRGHPMAKAGLEMALWDLIGKATGQSLFEQFQGSRDRVEVGVSVGIQEDPHALVAAVAAYLGEGYRRVKVKIKPGRDVEDIRVLRAAYPDVPLQVDANAAYTFETAQGLKPLDSFDLLLIEQPLAEDDLWDHSRLQRAFQTPICLDESIVSVRHARQALEMGACRVVNIKPGRVGGLSRAIAIHDLCAAQGIPVWCGGMLETGVGRAANLALASLPGFNLPGDISATRRYYAEDITRQRFVLNADSTISVPKGPGLGIEIDNQALKRVRVKHLRLA